MEIIIGHVTSTQILVELLFSTTVFLGFSNGIEYMSIHSTTIQSITLLVQSNTRLLYGFTTRYMGESTIV